MNSSGIAHIAVESIILNLNSLPISTQSTKYIISNYNKNVNTILHHPLFHNLDKPASTNHAEAIYYLKGVAMYDHNNSILYKSTSIFYTDE